MRTQKRVPFLATRVLRHAVRGRRHIQHGSCRCDSCQHKKLAIEYFGSGFFRRRKGDHPLGASRNNCLSVENAGRRRVLRCRVQGCGKTRSVNVTRIKYNLPMSIERSPGEEAAVRAY